MSRMEIPSKKNAGEIYLSRLRIVQTPWFAVMVHNVNEPDYDRDPHDHPWNFGSLILRGGYTERVWDVPQTLEMDVHYERRWNQLSWHTMSVYKAHRIMYVKPGTISLIFTGRRSRNWGFWTKDGWVQWNDYLDEGSTV